MNASNELIGLIGNTERPHASRRLRDACDVRVQVHNTRQRTAAMQSPIGGFRMWVEVGWEVCACAFYSQGRKVGHEVAVRG